MAEKKVNLNKQTRPDLGIFELQYALVERVLNVLIVAAILPLLAGAYYVFLRGNPWSLVLYAVIYVALLLVWLWKDSPYILRISVLLAIPYGLAAQSLAQTGLTGNGDVFLVIFCFTAVIFGRRRSGWYAIGVSVVTLLMFGALFLSETLVLPVEIQSTSLNPAAWLSYSLAFLVLVVFLVVSEDYLLVRLYGAFVTSQEMADALELGRAEVATASKKAQLQSRRARLVAEFGCDLISMRQREELVWFLVREVLRLFDLYHVNLFLRVARDDNLVLFSIAGEQSEFLMQKGMRDYVVGGSLPSRVAQIGVEQALTLEPGDLARFPKTRAEVGLPLVVRGELLGVLDIHSTQLLFSKEELKLFRVIAGYAAVALDFLRSLDESENKIREMRALYAQYTMNAWRKALESERIQSYVAGDLREEAVKDLATAAIGERKHKTATLAEGQGHVLIVPLTARDVPFGYLAFQRAADKGAWEDEHLALIESAADRLALALDNAYLLIEARQQVFYEERLGQINDVVWSTPSVENIMERTVEVLGRFLEADEVVLNITTSQEEFGLNEDVKPD